MRRYNSISISSEKRKRAADSENSTADEVDKVSDDLEME